MPHFDFLYIILMTHPECFGITGPDPAKFTESTESSGPGLRNLSENTDLSYYEVLTGTENHYLESKYYYTFKALIYFKLR